MDSGNKNKVLGGAAAVLLIAAGVILYVSYGRSSADTQTAAADDPNKMVTVRCSECGAEWEISAADYDKKKADRDNPLDKLVCDKCGAKKAWRVTAFEKGHLPPVPEEMKEEAIKAAEEAGGSPGKSNKKKMTRAGPVVKP